MLPAYENTGSDTWLTKRLYLQLMLLSIRTVSLQPYHCNEPDVETVVGND